MGSKPRKRLTINDVNTPELAKWAVGVILKEKYSEGVLRSAEALYTKVLNAQQLGETLLSKENTESLLEWIESAREAARSVEIVKKTEDMSSEDLKKNIQVYKGLVLGFRDKLQLQLPEGDIGLYKDTGELGFELKFIRKDGSVGVIKVLNNLRNCTIIEESGPSKGAYGLTDLNSNDVQKIIDEIVSIVLDYTGYVAKRKKELELKRQELDRIRELNEFETLDDVEKDESWKAVDKVEAYLKCLIDTQLAIDYTILVRCVISDGDKVRDKLKDNMGKFFEKYVYGISTPTYIYKFYRINTEWAAKLWWSCLYSCFKCYEELWDSWSNSDPGFEEAYRSACSRCENFHVEYQSKLDLEEERQSQVDLKELFCDRLRGLELELDLILQHEFK